MARVFKLQNVRGDGTQSDDTFSYYPDVDSATNKPFCDDKGVPWIEMSLRPVTKEIYRGIVKRHTTTGADGSGSMAERTDWEAVNADAVVVAIADWRGFVGADDRQLVCSDAAKRALDPMMRTAVLNRTMYGQPVEVTAESFREPASLR